MARKLRGLALKQHLEILTGRERLDVIRSRQNPIEAFRVECVEPGEWAESTPLLPLHKALYIADRVGTPNTAVLIHAVPFTEASVRG